MRAARCAAFSNSLLFDVLFDMRELIDEGRLDTEGRRLI